ncbi:hypothetical protein [Actinocorallia libanotica]|uniref:Uncharacterized protein n=1 Tax=Actinocorallia libanotica TaxID=46162 RepID=A0ABP4C9P0_9ACTN
MCAATTEDLQNNWPDWRIWRSSGGSWMATRRRTLTVDEVSEGLAHTLMENAEHELLAELDEQQRIESNRDGMK